MILERRHLVRRHAEYALDAVRISNHDLDVRFGVKSGAGIERLAFNKDAAEGVDQHARIFSDLMQPSDHGAIQVSSPSIRAVHRQTVAVERNTFLQTFMSKSDPFNSRSGSQVATETEFDNCSYNKRLVLSCGFSCGGFASEFDASSRIGFPEVDARTEPIVFVIAWLKRFASKQSLTNLSAAAVIAEDEGG